MAVNCRVCFGLWSNVVRIKRGGNNRIYKSFKTYWRKRCMNVTGDKFRYWGFSFFFQKGQQQRWDNWERIVIYWQRRRGGVWGVGRKGCYPNEAELASISTLLLLYFLIITHHPILLPPKKSNFSDILFLVEIDLWDVREVWRLRSCWCWEKTSYLKEANLPPVHYNHPAHMVSIEDATIVLSIFP